jgi:hypothetical protein
MSLGLGRKRARGGGRLKKADTISMAYIYLPPGGMESLSVFWRNLRGDNRQRVIYLTVQRADMLDFASAFP